MTNAPFPPVRRGHAHGCAPADQNLVRFLGLRGVRSRGRIPLRRVFGSVFPLAVAGLPACAPEITTGLDSLPDWALAAAAGGKGGGDVTAPSVPENLAAIQDASFVQLSWSESTDDKPGKVKYEIFRDANLLADASNNEFTDETVYGGETYSYQVLAFDKAGNRSALSAPVSITVSGAPPPAPTCGLSAYPPIIPVGASSTLTLTGSGAYTSVTLDSEPVTLVNDVYTEVVSPVETTEYMALIDGPGGSSSCTVTVTIGDPPPPPPPGASCLATALTIEIARSGENNYFFNTLGHAVDASGVTWVGDGSESTTLETYGSMQSCFSGGTTGAVIDGAIPFDAMYECTRKHCPSGGCPKPCYAYHSAAGVGPDVTNLQIFEDLLIRRTGDGISMDSDDSRDVIARRIYMSEIHDDAFEADFGLGGFLIEDVLVESASTAFAMRLRSSAAGTDQTDKVWDIRNSLVRLVDFPNGYKQRVGHGNLYKLEGDANEPIFKIVGNTFVLGPVMSSTKIMPPVTRTHECSDNTILWVGTQAQWDFYQTDSYHPDGGDNGQRLAALNANHGPTCMDVRIKPDALTVDQFLTQEGWYAAVDDWKNTHPVGWLN